MEPKRVSLALALLVLCVGCGRGVSPDGTDTIARAIVGNDNQVDPHAFIPAIARVSLAPTNGLCSGTLVAPNKILTAAHCFCPKNGKNPTGGVVDFADSTGNIVGPQWSFNLWDVAPGAAVCADEWAGLTPDDPLGHSASDVAVITLNPNSTTPALPTATPVRVFLGDPGLNFGANSVGKMLLPNFWVVGYGNNFPLDFLAPDGCIGCNVRRSGQLNQLFLVSAPCDTLFGVKDPFPQDCWEGRLWTAKSVFNGETIETSAGDSGGPLLLNVDQTSTPTPPVVVAGVSSSWWQDGLGPPFPEAHTKWATTGDNADFLRAAIGLPFTYTLDVQKAFTAVFAMRDLNVNDRAHVVQATGNNGARVVANRFVQLGVEALVGDINSRDIISLRDRSTARNVATRSTVFLGNGVHTTSITQGAFQQFEDLVLPTVEQAYGVTYPAPIGHVNVGPNATDSRAPGIWGDFIVYNGGNLVLSDGRYIFHDLQLESGSRLTISGTRTWVFIASTGNLIMRGVVAAPPDGLFVGAAQAASVTIGNTFNGTLVAPNANVDIDMVTNAVYTGAVFTRDFTLHEGEFLKWVSFPARWIPTCNGVSQNCQ